MRASVRQVPLRHLRVSSRSESRVRRREAVVPRRATQRRTPGTPALGRRDRVRARDERSFHGGRSGGRGALSDHLASTRWTRRTEYEPAGQSRASVEHAMRSGRLARAVCQRTSDTRMRADPAPPSRPLLRARAGSAIGECVPIPPVVTRDDCSARQEATSGGWPPPPQVGESTFRIGLSTLIPLLPARVDSDARMRGRPRIAFGLFMRISLLRA
jgi:hypothetical protein